MALCCLRRHRGGWPFDNYAAPGQFGRIDPGSLLRGYRDRVGDPPLFCTDQRVSVGGGRCRRSCAHQQSRKPWSCAQSVDQWIYPEEHRRQYLQHVLRHGAVPALRNASSVNDTAGARRRWCAGGGARALTGAGCMSDPGMPMGLKALTRELHADERPQLLAHLLALGEEDRRLRFAHALSDDGVRHYVESIELSRDAVFVVTDANLAIVGAAHLAREDGQAELGMSVLPQNRGHGVGGALLERCAARARNWGVRVMFMNCLKSQRRPRNSRAGEFATDMKGKLMRIVLLGPPG